MAGSRKPGVLGASDTENVHDGTLVRAASPLPGLIGRQPAAPPHSPLVFDYRPRQVHPGLSMLRKGAHGKQVRWLQVMLNEHRAAHPPLRVDGVFGPKTLAAVVNFQTTVTLPPDGVVGMQTWLKVLTIEPASAKAVSVTGSTVVTTRQQDGVSAAPPVASWSLRRRFEEVLKLTPNHMKPELAAQFRAMLTPLNIGIMVGTLAAWAVSHAFGAGEIADIILTLVGAVFLGLGVFKAGWDIGECMAITVDAESYSDLDHAADDLAQAIAILGVVAFFALLAKVGAKLGKAATAGEDEAGAGAGPKPEPKPRGSSEPGPDEPKDSPPSKEQGTGETPPEVIAQRQATAKSFYQAQGWPDAKIASHMEGIDFNKPVEVVTLEPGETVTQWQLPGNPQGNYYTVPGTDPGTLGIDPAGRVPQDYVVKEPVQVLQSTAATVKAWDGSGNMYTGGGTQFFTTQGGSFGPK